MLNYLGVTSTLLTSCVITAVCNNPVYRGELTIESSVSIILAAICLSNEKSSSNNEGRVHEYVSLKGW